MIGQRFFLILITSLILESRGLTRPSHYDRKSSIKEYLEELHPWERLVRDFRSEHQFLMLGGFSRNLWDLAIDDVWIFNASKVNSYQIVLAYEFHLQLSGGFGYFLGSSLGYVWNEEVKQKRLLADDGAQKKVDFGHHILMPGAVCGLIYNLHPAWRMGFFLEGFLERFENLAASTSEQDFTIRSANGRVLGRGIFFDWFYQVDRGIRLTFHEREAAHDPVHLNYRRRARLGTIGLVTHLL